MLGHSRACEREHCHYDCPIHYSRYCNSMAPTQPIQREARPSSLNLRIHRTRHRPSINRDTRKPPRSQTRQRHDPLRTIRNCIFQNVSSTAQLPTSLILPQTRRKTPLRTTQIAKLRRQFPRRSRWACDTKTDDISGKSGRGPR
jgi:hypothetical protein